MKLTWIVLKNRLWRIPNKQYINIKNTEEINKIALSSDDDKRIQYIDSIETHAYGTSKDLVKRRA